MSMNKPLFEIGEKDMQCVMTHYVPGNGYAWATLFPLKQTRKLDIKGIEGNEGPAIAAEHVAFSTKAPLKTRETIGRWEAQLKKNAVSRERDEIAINEYNTLKTLARYSDDPQAARDMIAFIYDDVDFCNKSMEARNEVDCLNVASSGKLTFNVKYDGDRATADAINYNVPEDNYKGASVVWSNSKADGLGDIMNAVDAIVKTGYPKPRYAYMDKAAWLTLRGQENTALRLFPNAKNIAIYAQAVTLEAINAYMVQNGYPEIRYTDSYVRIEGANGKRAVVKPWNENVVTLCPEENLGHTYWMPIPVLQNSEALQTQGSYYTVSQYSDIDLRREVTKAESYILPVLENRLSTVFLNINATTWNNGEAQ